MAFISRIISKFLDRYIQQVSKTQIVTKAFDGHVELHNVSLQPDILTNFGIPLQILQNNIENMVIDYPFLQKGSHSAYLKIQNMDLLAKPDWDVLYKVEINSIASLLKSIADEKEASKSEKHHAWNSWMEKICDNARIDIENITIKIEIPLENQKCLFVLFIEKFTMFTSDENGKMIFLKENPEVLCKRILMKSFSLSFFPNSHESVSNDYQNEYNFLFPSTFSFDVIHERSKNAKFLNIFRLNFDPIFLEINHTQFEYFWLICKEIAKIKLRQKFVMCIRPKNSNYEKMWHYFYRCALKIRRPHNFSIKKAILFLKKRNKFTQKYQKSLMIKSFVNKSIKKYGEDLTFLLLQYALAIDHQRKRLIKLRVSEIKTLTSDDTVFFQKDSFQLVFKIQAISFKIHTLVHFVTNNFYFNFTSDKNAFIFNFLLNEFNIFNEVTKKHIVRVDDNFPNILQLYFSSKNEPVSLILAKLYVDLNHEFLKTLIHYFSFIVSQNNQKQVKSSNTNIYLQAINPNTSKQFKVILNGINAKYSVDEFHSFYGEIHKIEIKNYSKDSTNKIINFKMKIFLGDFIIDNLIIFQKCSIKSFTKGCINEYYYVDDIQTNLYIFDVNINVDNLVIDKCSSLLKSLKELKTNKNTKTYSSHQIMANCSDISVNFNTGYSLLLLNLYEIELNPKMRLKHVKIMSNQNVLVCIPSLTFDKWSVFTANSIHINLDSNEFYQFLDDSFWISSKLFSLYEAYFISEKTDNMEEQPPNENNNEIRIISHNIIYNMKNNYFINCGELELKAGEYIKIILNSCEIRNSNDKIILNVSKNIEILYCSQDKKNIFSFNLDCIFINFSYSDLCIVQYFTNDQHRQNSHINPSSYVVNKEDDLQNLITVKVNRIKISYANRLMVLSNSHLEISNQICTNIIIDQIFIDELFTISNFLYLKNGNKNKINIKLIDVLTSPDNFVFLYNLKDIFRSQNNSKNSEFQNKKSIDMTRYDIKIKTISIKESVTSLFLNSHDNKISYIPSNSLIMINIPLISSDYFLTQQNYIILKENELNFQVDNINLEFTHKLYFQITQACKAYVMNKSVNNSLSKENESDTSFILHFKLNSFTFQESDIGSIILQDVTFDKIKQSFHFKLGKIKSNIIHQTVLCDPTHFIQICFDNNYITIHFSQFDIFLDIEKIIQYISFYKSFKSWFLSLKDVIKPDSNQTNFNDFPMIQCILHDVNLHFPFPDDVLFKEHDLTMSLDLIMNSNNGSLELFVKVSNIYFSAIQSRVKFLPVLSDFSAKLTLKNGHDISIETGPLNIYLSIIDMVELQIIFDNIIRSISPMTTSRSLYYEEKKKSYLHFQYFVVDSISLYLCKENRQSNNYNSLFKILLDSGNVEINDKYIIIQELFSIYHRNFVRSKFDSFLSPTKITLTYDHNNVNTTNFGLIIDNINVDFSTDSLNSIYQIIDEFHNQKDTAMIKHENSTDPEYWIHNNLYDLIKLTCDNEHEFIINSHDHIPIFQIKKDSELNIEIRNKNFKIIPKNIIFPLYCDNYSVSLIKYHNSLSIEFSSLLSIKNKLDFPFFIYINTKGSTNFIKYIKLMPGYKHPIFFNENSYIFVTNINSGIKPECYTFSAHSYPNDIKIVTDGMEIKYQIIPKFNSQSNSKVYKIVPTIFIINSIPFSIQNNMIYSQIIQNNSTNNISVKSGEKKPLSFINKNSEKINMALSYSSKFGKSTEIALNPNSLYSYNISLDIEEESYQLAIYIQYLKHQKNIIIYVPCVIFNQSSQTIIISPNHRMLPNSILFYGPKTYFEKSKSTNLDITIEGQSIEGKNVIDCKILCPLSKTIYLQSSKYKNLLTPINYSNVMGKGKMNLTHIITFTSYLYVINELMYDFSLSPTKMNDSLLKEPFFIGCGQKVLIDWIPNDEKFLFSIFQFSSIPFIYLSRPTKTVFSMINKDQILYVELEIIEKESTLYATFRNPLFPTPFMINNSLKSSIYVSQFDSGRKTQIVESSTSIFAFDQPFLNSQIVIHINDIIERKYTFSLEEQIAPIVDNDDNKIIIELIVTGQNQKMVFVHYSNQIFGFKQSANFMLSINQIYISLFNRDMREFALLSINKVLINVKQDNQKSIMTFSTQSIQFDDQSFSPSYPVFLYGPNVGINPFIYVSSIFPRGIPFLSVIEYFNLNIQPIHIFLDMKFIWKLIDFYNSSNKKVKKSDKFPNVLQPAYKSISKNKIHILWAEISSIYASVKVNEEGVKSSIYSFILWTLNLSKGKTIEFPSLFLYNFNNSVSVLQERLVMFYGNSAIDSISKDSVLLYSVYGIVDWLNFVNFEKINFQAIMNTRRDNVNRSIYDNQKIVANYFNGLSLESLLNYLNIYLNEESEIIKSIINGNILYLQIYQFDNCIFGKNISKKENDAQIVENVERSRNPKVTPILTSNTENLVNLDEIQKNIFKQEPGHRSKIVFFLKSTEHNEYYCITYCKLFTLKNDMSIKSNYNLNQFEILNTNMSSVTLKSSQDDKLINIQLDSAEEVNLFVLFINAQKDFLDIFTNNKNKHNDQYHDE